MRSSAAQQATASSPKRELRVLHIITRMIVGGAQENTMYTVLGQQRTPGMRVTLLSGIDNGPEGNLHDRCAAEKIDLHLIDELVRPIKPHIDALALARVAAFIHRGGYDIVHTHSSKAGIVGRIAARMVGTPIVIHSVHGSPFGEHASRWKNALYTRLERMCAPLCDRIISVCDAMRDAYLAERIGRREQHVTVFSGFPIEPFLRIRDELSVADAKRSVGLAPEHLVVGKVARLFPQKGHDHFLEAARIIAARETRARFLLVGNGILREELEERTRAYGIRDRFVFAGLVPPAQVPRYIQAMDVAVHTSIREGLARVIPQASATGKPVVSFALDGAPEAIQHGESGWLAKPYDPGDVAERVLSILTDEERRLTMGEAGRRFAEHNFRVETMVDRINDVYWSLAERKLAHRPAA